MSEEQEISKKTLERYKMLSYLNQYDDLLDYVIINKNKFRFNKKRLPLLAVLERDIQNLDDFIDEKEYTLLDISRYYRRQYEFEKLENRNSELKNLKNRRKDIKETQEKTISSFLRKYDLALEIRINFYYWVSMNVTLDSIEFEG